MRTATGAIAAILVTTAVCNFCEAGSIWAKAGTHVRSPYADDTAKTVGDMLTILIEEKSEVGNETSRSMSKTATNSASVAGTADMMDMVSAVRGKKAFRFPEVDVNSSGKAGFDGSADFDTKRSMVDQITVAVEDVLPNGNLVVLGTRLRNIDGEKQVVQVSGVVRPSDIAFTNTIQSQRVADFRLVLTLEGTDNSYTKPGWLTQIVNFINPF